MVFITKLGSYSRKIQALPQGSGAWGGGVGEGHGAAHVCSSQWVGSPP